MNRIKLDLTCLKYKVPKGLVKKIEIELENINEYPSGSYSNLKEKIAKYCKVKKENIIVGNGADEIIDMITRVYGKKVLIPFPTFSQFEVAAKRCNSKISLINCFENFEYNIKFPREKLKEATLVWVCNPNSPTGGKIPRAQIIEVLNNTNAIVAVDECYFEFFGETVLDLINKYKNLIVLRSFSKGFGICGLRLGFAISQKENTKKLEEIRQPFNVNKLAEIIGSIIFEYEDYYKKVRKKTIKTRENFSKKLSEIGLKPLESFTNFVFVKFRNMKEAEYVYKELGKNNISVFPAWDTEFSCGVIPFIRFSIGTEKEMETVIKILKRIIKV